MSYPSSSSVLCWLLFVSAVAAAEPAPAAPNASWTDWSQTAKAGAYATVRADAPLCTDKALWPLLDGREAYVTETWPKARLLVWAKPGVNGSWTDAACWLQEGKPAAAAPDQDTDVVLADADRPYVVKNPAGFIACRHVTLGKGSMFEGGDGHELRYFGNCWVKIGACLYINVAVPVGAKHTFCRNDHAMGRTATGHPSGNNSEKNITGNIDGHYIHVNKDKDGSVEFLGVHHAADKIYLKSGTTIVGPDSCLMSGGWNRPVVEPPATLVLMSGSCTGQRDFNDGRFCQDSLRVEGVLQAGTHERPLTRDAVVSLNYKDCATYPNARGVIVGSSGQIGTYSADPAKARLVFRWSGVDQPVDPKSPNVDSGADVPRRICLSLLGKAAFDGVLFMDVDRGGIQLADPTQQEMWKHVAYGANNGAAPVDLYAGASAQAVIKKKVKTEANLAAPTASGALYASQVWKPLRQLTWAKPGQDGNPDVEANWLEDGKPASSAPDRNCDVSLPESPKPYRVGSEKIWNVSARHLTIGRNATLCSRQVILYGNLWINEGGSLATTAGMMLKGINHCFVRDDNPPVHGKVAAKGLTLFELIVRKGMLGDPSSVEALGFIHIQDRLFFADPSAGNNTMRIGTSQFIVGPDATVTWGQFGGDSMHRTSEAMGTLVLLSGATFQRHHNAFQNGCDINTGAFLPWNLQAGTPERPLTKDAVLGLSAIEQDGQCSLLLRGGNSISVASTDPAKARLVLRWHGQQSEALAKRSGTPHLVLKLFGTLPTTGLLFDDLAKGGLQLGDPAVAKSWGTTAFGSHCEGPLEALVVQESAPR